MSALASGCSAALLGLASACGTDTATGTTSGAAKDGGDVDAATNASGGSATGTGAVTGAGGATSGAGGSTQGPGAGGASNGTSCDPKKALCRALPPSCQQGEVPSVDGSCWGPCVPIASCSCTAASDCPDPNQYTCHLSRGVCDYYVN